METEIQQAHQNTVNNESSVAQDFETKLSLASCQLAQLQKELEDKTKLAADYLKRAEDTVEENQNVNEKCLHLMKENKKLMITKSKLEKLIDKLQ